MQVVDFRFLQQQILRCGVAWPPPPALVSPDLAEADEEDLLDLIKVGSQAERADAFTSLYARYYLAVWYFIISKVSLEADAKDVFSKAWCIAFDKLPRFVWRGISIKVWLFSIANNKCLELFREMKERSYISYSEIHEGALLVIDTALRLDEELSPAVPHSEVVSEADRLLHKALSKLKPRQRKIIELVYYKGKNSTEIGEILHMKPGTVRQEHKRARKKLQQMLE